MERQFILRLPEQLQDINFSEAKLVKHSDSQVTLTLPGGRSYSGVMARMPCVVECHKNIDGKLYKAADIGTVVVISEKEADAEEEIERAERSGLTPPMADIGASRQIIPVQNDVEQRVAELLREDAKAAKVEVEREEESSEIEEFGAEIESGLPAAPPQGAAETEEQIGVQKSLRPAESVEGGVAVEEPAAKEVEKPEEIVELEKRIKEKQELHDKTLNPILKGRFAQALEELKREYEGKKREHGL